MRFPPEVNRGKTVYGSWARAERDRRFAYDRWRNDHQDYPPNVYFSHSYGGFVVGTRDRLAKRHAQRRPLDPK